MERNHWRHALRVVTKSMVLLSLSSAPLLAQTPDAATARAANVTRPDDYLKHPLAADFMLPDWDQVRGYFETLSAQSPRVKLEAVAKTAEGRDLVLATISSDENIANMAALKRYNALLVDPRKATRDQRNEALDKGRVFLFISCAMHSTECAAPQFAMRLAYTLATSEDEFWRNVRDQCVVLMLPSTNPDGLDEVAKWYRRTVGTPFEATEMTRLYQLYAGHDNNRDWFMLTQPETRAITKLLYDVWRPQVLWDVHQQGSKAERMFVPPFRDPLDPNLDPGIIAAINLLGTRAQLDMERAGKSGVATGGTFDMWWNGGNRNVPVRHNIVGLLTEAASCRLATPIFQQKSELVAPDGLKQYAPSNHFLTPWPGGWWHLSDIVDYEMTFARSLLGSLSRERRFFLENALEAADRTLLEGREGAPSAWIIPADQRDRGATKRLIDVLLATGIEVGIADAEVTADGRTYPTGSIAIRREQPYGAHAKDLFDVQRYPQGDAPYDVAGWTLPALLGVRRVEVIGRIDAKTHLVTSVDEALAAFRTDDRTGDTSAETLSDRDSDAWKSVFSGLAGGRSYSFDTKTTMAGVFVGYAKTEGDRDPTEPLVIAKMPRIGLYSPWSGSADEGWTRWVFDTFGVKHVIVRNEMLRAGNLTSFLDVLVLPGVAATELDNGRAEGSVFDEFAGGLDPEGAVAVEAFVRGGGTLVAIGSSTKWAIDLLKLPLVDVTAAPEAKEFNCPGSVLRTIPQPGSVFTSDLDESVCVFFSRGQAFRDMTDKERADSKSEKTKVDHLLRYAPTRLLVSGWIAKSEVIEERSAWVRAAYGQGAVHLFGFRPQYRGWSQASFQLLFRALLFESRGVTKKE
jgi:hypothetical protein